MGASFAFSILYNMTLAPIEVELICFAIFTIDKFFFKIISPERRQLSLSGVNVCGSALLVAVDYG